MKRYYVWKRVSLAFTPQIERDPERDQWEYEDLGILPACITDDFENWANRRYPHHFGVELYRV